MKVNKWTVGLAAAGLVTLAPAVLAQATNAPAPAPIPMLTTLSATTISGYVDTSAVWNPGTGNAHPAPYAFNAGKQDGFNLDAVDIKIAKPQDETGWSGGYVAELSYGPDAMAIDNGGGSGTYPIRQAYVALHMPVGNGIDWQLGRWDNLLGYESSDSYKNPNFTRSYGYSFEPTEHTGLLGNYNITSALNLQVGVADTVTTEGVNARTAGGLVVEKSLVSLLTFTAPDSWGAFKGSAFYGGFDYGQGAAPAAPGAPPAKDKKELYIGATVNTPVSGLTFGASWDAIFHNDVGGVDESYFQAFAGYGSYKLTDKLTLNGRVEYADGLGLGAAAGSSAVTFVTGEGGSTTIIVPNPLHSVIAITGTLQYDLWANVISRLEVRWDHAADGSEAFGGDASSGGLPDKKNEVLVAANVIYKF